MCIHARHLLFAIWAWPLISVGCSISQNQVATSRSPVETNSSGGELAERISVGESSGTPVTATVVEGYKRLDVLRNEAVETNKQIAKPVTYERFAAVDSGLTLAAVEQLALTHNPALKQAQAASARAGGIRTQVGLRPNPTVGYFGEEIGNEGTGGLHGAFISQTIVRGDKLKLNRQVINNDVREMNRLVETQKQRIRTDIQLAFYAALSAQKRLELAHDFRQVAKDGVVVTEERVIALTGSRPDVLQSQIQLNEVDLSIRQAEFDLSAALNEMAALAGVPHLSTTTLIGELEDAFGERDAETEFAHILAMSPQLSAAQVRVDRARANICRQQVQAIPNLTAQLGVGHDNGTGDEFANVQLSLPIPVHNRNQGNLRAAHAEYCAATQDVLRIRQSIRRDLARVMQEYNIANATVEQYQRQILPKSRETLALMKEAQDAGEFDFLRVLTVRRAYFDANVRYVTALGELAQANAKLDGLLLSGGLSNVVSYDGGDDLRGQALSGQ